MVPDVIPNWINGEQCLAAADQSVPKLDPATGERLCELTRSQGTDVEQAVAAASRAFRVWSAKTPVERGAVLREVALALRAATDEMAAVVAAETGKSPAAATGEAGGAFELGMFMAGEGRRLYGRTPTSAMVGKHASPVRRPLVVCDDAELERAVEWTVLSAFSNAGQRCASGSRVIVFDAVCEAFRELLVTRTQQLSFGTGDDDDLGPVINQRQLDAMVAAVDEARSAGATVLVGGDRLRDEEHAAGFFMAPTLIEDAPPNAEVSTRELFGPIACLYRAPDFEAAVALANDSPYGLTASIHTVSVHRALEFADRVESGVIVVNAGTYGSEPHMPFGGVKASGNGWREPGTEALDVYSNLQDRYVCVSADLA